MKRFKDLTEEHQKAWIETVLKYGKISEYEVRNILRYINPCLVDEKPVIRLILNDNSKRLGNFANEKVFCNRCGSQEEKLWRSDWKEEIIQVCKFCRDALYYSQGFDKRALQEGITNFEDLEMAAKAEEYYDALEAGVNEEELEELSYWAEKWEGELERRYWEREEKERLAIEADEELRKQHGARYVETVETEKRKQLETMAEQTEKGDDEEAEECPKCGGSGQIRKSSLGINNFLYIPCPVCQEKKQ